MAKCFTPSSVTWLLPRFKLLILQLVCVSAMAKCFTPSSVTWLLPRFKLLILQLVCVSAVAKCFTPTSVTWLPKRFNLFSSQNPWLFSLPGNNFAIPIHPSDWRWLWRKSKSKMPWTDLSACTNPKQPRGVRLQLLKSSALQPIRASFSSTCRLVALASNMQLNNVSTNALSSSAGQQVSVSVRISGSSVISLSKSLNMAIKYLAFFRKQFCSKLHHIYHAWISFDDTGNKILHFVGAIGVYQIPHRNNLQIKKYTF